MKWAATLPMKTNWISLFVAEIYVTPRAAFIQQLLAFLLRLCQNQQGETANWLKKDKLWKDDTLMCNANSTVAYENRLESCASLTCPSSGTWTSQHEIKPSKLLIGSNIPCELICNHLEVNWSANKINIIGSTNLDNPKNREGQLHYLDGVVWLNVNVTTKWNTTHLTKGSLEISIILYQPLWKVYYS